MRRLAILSILVAAACASEAPADRPSLMIRPGPEAVVHAVLPAVAKRFAPAQVEIAGGGDVDGQWMSDVDGCDGCHTDVVAMWKTSAHAFASFNNPVYRLSIEKFRAEAGNEKSRMCGGCHDVSLLVAGAMDKAIDPGDWRAHAGVTCKSCHSIEEARADGNGSYTLTSLPIPIPKQGDPESVRLHKERVALKPLRGGVEICGSCHRAFLGQETGNAHFFAGTDDITPWRRSEFGGSKVARIDDPIEARDCRGCHMQREAAPLGDVSAKGGTIASHRFLGGHSWLASMRGDKAQLARFERFLKGTASIDVAVATDEHGGRALPADGAKIAAGERTTFDVVIRNLGVGHRFPGGTLDSQDTFVEVAVEDANGKKLASHGGDDAHRLRAIVADEKGQPHLERDVNHFRAVVHNHTLAPRDAEVIEYAFDAPADLAKVAQPLKVTARLLHRTRNLALQAAACADSRTERGIAFRGRTPLDPCPEQPVIEIARSEVFVGENAAERGSNAAPTWRRLLDHGYGMMHAVQERIDEARPSFDRALLLLGDSNDEATVRNRAAVLAALGALEGHEGRTAEAIADFDRAAALLPGDPALASLEGIALTEVWRWEEAIDPLRAAARAAPNDDGAALRLAVALSSRGSEDRAALDAAWAGLALTPRDPDLLRVQAISLASLGADPGEIERAKAAYDLFRVQDDAPAVKTQCAKTVPGCALERLPVHVHVMMPTK